MADTNFSFQPITVAITETVKEGYCFELSDWSTQAVTLCNAATDFVFCVALMDGVTGDRISAMPMGPIVKGYGTVTAKALVSPTTDGTWIDAATGNRPCALALEAATAGEFSMMLLGGTSNLQAA